MRHYSDENRLVALECDECGKLIAPNPDIANSGWRQCGVIEGSDSFEYIYCPDHADIADRIGERWS